MIIQILRSRVLSGHLGLLLNQCEKRKKISSYGLKRKSRHIQLDFFQRRLPDSYATYLAEVHVCLTFRLKSPGRFSIGAPLLSTTAQLEDTQNGIRTTGLNFHAYSRHLLKILKKTWPEQSYIELRLNQISE